MLFGFAIAGYVAPQVTQTLRQAEAVGREVAQSVEQAAQHVVNSNPTGRRRSNGGGGSELGMWLNSIWGIGTPG